jgi:hypothetical protein
MGSISMQQKQKIAISLFVKVVEEYNIIIRERNAQFMDIVKHMGKLIIKKHSSSFPIL